MRDEDFDAAINSASATDNFDALADAAEKQAQAEPMPGPNQWKGAPQPNPDPGSAQRFAAMALKYGPPIAGSLAATAMTGGASLPAQMGMQALMTGGGTAISKLPGQISALVQGKDQPQTSGQVAKDIARTGASAAATTGLIGGAGKLLSSDAATTAGAQAMKASAGVAQKYGKGALSDLENLSRAPTDEELSASYDAFQKYAGLKSLSDKIEERSGSFSVPELEKMVFDAGKKVKAGQDVSNQELFLASQAENQLQKMAKYGDPSAKNAVMQGLIQTHGKRIDDALQESLPEYGSLRAAAFFNAMKGAFSSALPLNKDGTASVLRAWAPAMMGHPAALPFTSPLMLQMMIASANAASKVLPSAAPAATTALSTAIGGNK